MQRYSANYIFPVSSPPIKNGIITLDNNKIIDVFDPGSNLKELASMEFHNGVIVPGFVNAHCHLELSHLKGKIEPSGGIAQFVSGIRENRNAAHSEIEPGIEQALSSLKDNGTIAIGDICNTSDTLKYKQKSHLLFHNFVETFGLNQVDAHLRYNASMNLLNVFKSDYKGNSSVTPHATYSISELLWELINSELTNSKSIVSIHYGESEQEYLLLKEHSGPLAENFRAAGIPLDLPDCKSPMNVVVQFIPNDSKVLFVHNTFASKEEITSIVSYFKEPYFVLCPSSNLFIERALPNVPMLVGSGATIALGTDSYASSNTISIFDQMMILMKEFPSLTFEDVLSWATLNGAKALNFDTQVGSFEPNKKPGLNLITNFDFSKMKPTTKSIIKRLV